jgi:hypothetical protein
VERSAGDDGFHQNGLEINSESAIVANCLVLTGSDDQVGRACLLDQETRGPADRRAPLHGTVFGGCMPEDSFDLRDFFTCHLELMLDEPIVEPATIVEGDQIGWPGGGADQNGVKPFGKASS